jgi:three-Cys-motif partner protein
VDMDSSGQKFGGVWTVLKLEKVEKYLAAYTTALKRMNFNLCYVDAFAGNGAVQLNNLELTDGSALRALKYDFDRFYYFDRSVENCQRLTEIRNDFLEKDIRIQCCDSNDALKSIHTVNWFDTRWRGIIFLDPYAMNLDWNSLECIARTRAFDIWYLFPISAMLRNLRRDGKIDQATRDTLTRFLGTEEWYVDLYKPNPQLRLFDEEDDYLRVGTEEVIDYVLRRLNTLFVVSKDYLLLRNSKESPLFLLCFMICNRNHAAIDLSMKIAGHILTH